MQGISLWKGNIKAALSAAVKLAFTSKSSFDE